MTAYLEVVPAEVAVARPECPWCGAGVFGRTVFFRASGNLLPRCGECLNDISAETVMALNQQAPKAIREIIRAAQKVVTEYRGVEQAVGGGPDLDDVDIAIDELDKALNPVTEGLIS